MKIKIKYLHETIQKKGNKIGKHERNGKIKKKGNEGRVNERLKKKYIYIDETVEGEQERRNTLRERFGFSWCYLRP